MKKITLIATTLAGILFLGSCKKEQRVTTDRINFEDMSLGDNGYTYGDTAAGGFHTGNAFFPTHFSYGLWSGFAVTNRTDDTTRGYTNLYSAIAGEGAGHSDNYAVYYAWNPDTIVFEIPEKITGMSVCNSTYAYYSMLEGDQFAKKFGGESGDDPDYFKLIIEGFDAGNNKVLEGTITLADYTFETNARDFVSNVWTDIDLSQAGFLKYLVLSFDSSDKGPGGINTPKLICLDNIYGELQE
ncbi:MAG TPA: DUF4465 domain-containing protein [Bacteroidales bacterium]|nr:DUF4465 domain-containing protein [Bacteroidales bacterium]